MARRKRETVVTVDSEILSPETARKVARAIRRFFLKGNNMEEYKKDLAMRQEKAAMAQEV